MPRRGVAAEAKRRRAEILAARAAGHGPLPEEFLTWLHAGYQPHLKLRGDWPLVAPLVEQTLFRSKVRGPESLRKRTTHLGYFWQWALGNGYAPDVDTTFVRTAVDEYARVGMTHTAAESRASRRSILRRIADQIHPEAAPHRAVSVSYKSIKPPYRPDEMAAIARVASVQPTARLRQKMEICVACGAGAGIDSKDLKLLRGRNVEDLGERGIRLHVPGPRARVVTMLREYEAMLRHAVQGVAATDLLIGRNPDRANVTSSIFHEAVLLGDVPHIEQSRLRSTWLATLMSRPIPLAVILRAAGLTSARTLPGLLPFITPVADAAEGADEDAGSDLRGGELR